MALQWQQFNAKIFHFVNIESVDLQIAIGGYPGHQAILDAGNRGFDGDQPVMGQYLTSIDPAVGVFC